MRRLRINMTAELLWQCAEAIVLVLFLSVPVFLIGREALGETVIALLYLAIVAWSACRWGQCAAVMATPAFNFLFIPPFFASAMRQLEGWLGSRSSSAYPLSSSAGSRMRLRRGASVKGMHASYMSSGLRWGGSARTRPCCMPWLGTCRPSLLHRWKWPLRPSLRLFRLWLKFQSMHTLRSHPTVSCLFRAAPEVIGEIHIWRGNG
jgi:hypothetical protein